MHLDRLPGLNRRLILKALLPLTLLCAALHLPGAAAQTIINLGWDVAGDGSVSLPQPDTLGGDYYFQINPETSLNGA